jgi:hypothetical protein
MKPEGSVLLEAEAAVNGPRNKSYGHPADNHDRTARLWQAWLDIRCGHINASDVCILNILQKVSRLANGYHRDSCVDIAGYAENLSIIAEGRSPGEHQ